MSYFDTICAFFTNNLFNVDLTMLIWYTVNNNKIIPVKPFEPQGTEGEGDSGESQLMSAEGARQISAESLRQKDGEKYINQG